MSELVKNEVTKLLDVRIIYLISDDKWVILVHVVPKKCGMNFFKNERGDSLVTCIVT